MNILPNARQAWQIFRALRAAKAGQLSHEREILIDGREIGSYDALQGAREAQASTASRLDPMQTRVPQYPPVSPRSMFNLGYRRNEVVRRCYDLIIESVMRARPELQDARGNTKRGRLAAEFDKLMRSPAGDDSDLTGSDVQVRFWLDVLGTGNGMLEKVPGRLTRHPVQLWRMDPWRTVIEPDEKTRIRRYLYRLGGQWFEIPRERVIHFRPDWDPISDFWGLPRLFSAFRSLAADSDLVDMMKITLQNIGVPPVVLQYPLSGILEGMKSGGPLSMTPDKEMITEVQRIWQERHGGSNRGKAGVAWGFEVKTVGLDFQKLAIGALVATTERRILMVHGVNPLLVGQSGTEQQRGHNFGQAKEFFYETTIGGFLDKLDATMSSRLAPDFGAERYFSRMDHVPAFRDAKLRRGGEAAEIFKSGILRRHACQQLIGEPADGDDIFYPDVYGASTTTTIAAEPDEEVAEDVTEDEGDDDEQSDD